MEKKLAIVLTLTAFAVSVSTSWAESPVSHVTLHTHAKLDPFVPGLPWEGLATLTLDEVEYEGTMYYVGGKSKMNENNFHGFASGTYDFPGLGSFEIWERAKTVFEIVETDPFYRFHTYTGINKITAGTGAFADASGVLHLDGYTEYEFRIDDDLGPRVAALSDYVSDGMIYGIDLSEAATTSVVSVPEPSTSVMLLTAGLGIAAFEITVRRKNYVGSAT